MTMLWGGESLHFQTARPGDTPVTLLAPLPVMTVGDTTVSPIKFARVNATADGVNVVVAPVAAKKIRVLGYALVVNAAGTITLQDSQGTPAISGSFPLAVNGGVSYAGSREAPAFETGVGFGFDISNAAGVDTLGHICYVEV